MATKYLLLFNYVDYGIETNYRGIFRKGFHNMPINEKDNEEFDLWLASASKTDDDSFFTDIETAKEFAIQNKTYGKHFDIVACVDVTGKDETVEEIPCPKEFLGYDVTDKHKHSFIFWFGYTNYKENSTDLKEDNFLEVVSREYFSKKLNRYKLFDDYQMAKVFAKMEFVIIQTHPHLNQLHLEKEYKIFKLYNIKFE